ncbi:unnamed protein product [Paramecium octaurelia]|uniref:BCNT-C domain-containing protein n=1 Tax=Paramecium octaurelia TaxID=43137 RepID=A0A8S1SAN3_PAROT|nr:unnamed protein product [Paramecium octaurelia]
MSKKKIKLYGIDIESDDDQEYVPDEQDISENNKNLSHHKTFNIDEIYQEMKKIDLYQPKVCTKTAQQIVREVLDEQNRVQVKRVKFAGKSFLINDKGEIQEENIEPVQTKQIKQPIGNSMSMKELRESFRYYREVIKKLTNKAKTINSVTKSKLDWKQYTTKEKLETQMEQKRKSGQGVLEKAKFINRTNERVKSIRHNKIKKL